jgi:hypothetical protein
MANPLTFRPGPESDVDHDGKTAEWEDNKLSNALAWASTVFVPTWCQNEQHWTARFANSLFTTCPCCMIFRGITIGAAGMALISVAIFAMISLIT